MTTKKKKQAPSQQGQKSSAVTNSQLKSSARIKFKSKHKDDGVKVASNSLIPFSKYGFGYASVVLILGMCFILWIFGRCSLF